MKNVLFLISMLLGAHTATVAQTTVYHYLSEPYVAFDALSPGTDYPITWSFDNGVLALSEAEQYLAGALVSTDANGDITSIGLNGLSAKPTYANGQKLNGFIILFTNNANNGIEGSSEGFVFNDLMCTTDNDEQCHELDISSYSSAAVLPMGGSWSRASEPSTDVASLGGFALGLGALMLGMVVRRSPPGEKISAAH